MALPQVVIVGRPNVGKSSLLNWLAGRRIAIVDPTAGTTRDRVTALATHNDHWFELTDTGGIGIVDVDQLEDHVEDQIRYAIAQADLVLFVVEAGSRLTALDTQIANRLRKLGKPVLLLANKADSPRDDDLLGEYTRLGFGDAITSSVKSVRGKADLLDAIVNRLAKIAPASDAPPADPELKVAVVGKRNAGKSTFINAVVGQPRVIVSEVPGTTRDSVDVRFEKDGRPMVIIDTAGVKKRPRLRGDIEFYSLHRSERSIRRADVVLLVLDATEPFGEVEKKLAAYIAENFKPVLLIVNKWDLARPDTSPGAYREYFDQVMPLLRHAPMICTTAKDRRKVQTALDHAIRLHKQAGTRVGTGELNRAIEQSLAVHTPPLVKARKPPKIYFASQVGTHPVTIMLSVNSPANFAESFKRYLHNSFRQILPFPEVPIRLLLRSHHRKDEGTAGRRSGRRFEGAD